MNSLINFDIDKRYLSSIGRFFSPVVLSDIEKKEYSSYLSEVCKNSGLIKYLDLTITLGNFLNNIFRFLLNNYRNEYVYKNIIANKILLGRHSIKTSQMLTEFRVGKNKADVVILNGTSTIYEIKSEYDSFKRLDDQINSYIKAFEYVNLVTSPSQVDIAKKHLPKEVGILALTKEDTISIIRKPESNLSNLNLDFLFGSLRKGEYLSIINKFYGCIPDVPNTKIYEVSKKLYCDIPLFNAYKLTIDVLKKRNDSEYLKNTIDKIPFSVVAYILSIGNQQAKIRNYISLFDQKLSCYLI